MERGPVVALNGCVNLSAAPQHTQLISDCSQLLYCSAFWDVVFLCNHGERVHANRAFLAARSDFFRGLMFGGMQESQLTEIKLPQVKAGPLRLILHYLHTLETQSTGGQNCQANCFGALAVLPACCTEAYWAWPV